MGNNLDKNDPVRDMRISYYPFRDTIYFDMKDIRAAQLLAESFDYSKSFSNLCTKCLLIGFDFLSIPTKYYFDKFMEVYDKFLIEHPKFKEYILHNPTAEEKHIKKFLKDNENKENSKNSEDDNPENT